MDLENDGICETCSNGLNMVCLSCQPCPSCATLREEVKAGAHLVATAGDKNRELENKLSDLNEGRHPCPTCDCPMYHRAKTGWYCPECELLAVKEKLAACEKLLNEEPHGTGIPESSHPDGITILKARLAASEAQLCREREALKYLGEHFKQQGSWDQGRHPMEDFVAAALSSTGPCPHEARVKELQEEARQVCGALGEFYGKGQGTAVEKIGFMRKDFKERRARLEKVAEERGLTNVCPFCFQDDFDRVGLKYHLLAGYCDDFNEVAALAEVTK